MILVLFSACGKTDSNVKSTAAVTEMENSVSESVVLGLYYCAGNAADDGIAFSTAEWSDIWFADINKYKCHKISDVPNIYMPSLKSIQCQNGGISTLYSFLRNCLFYEIF